MKTKSIKTSPKILAANIKAAERKAFVPVDDGRFAHERITSVSAHDGSLVAGNASLFIEDNFQEKLTTFAVGFRDEAVQADMEFFCPRVVTPRRFEYATHSSPQEFYGSSTEDLRAIGGDFPKVEYTSDKVEASTKNRGLRICVDLDQVGEQSNWEQFYTAKLMRRLIRNKVLRAIALLSAAATNTAKTWDTSAGKDPDQDVITDLVAAATASGVKPNRVGYGDTSWSKRLLAHRAQSTAGGFSSAGLTPEQLAGLLSVERVHHSKSRYSDSGSTMAEIVSNLVLMFNASDNMDTEDASNIKDFVSNCANGQQFAVYTRQIGTKLYEIAVEHYELLKITSTLGIRKFTVS